MNEPISYEYAFELKKADTDQNHDNKNKQSSIESTGMQWLGESKVEYDYWKTNHDKKTKH